MHSPPSRIRQFLIGIGAIALALLAQQWLDQKSTTAAMVGYAIAAIFAIIAFRLPARESKPATDARSGAQLSPWRWSGFLLIGAGLIVSSVMLWRVDELNPTTFDWWLHLGSLALMVAGGTLCDPLPTWRWRERGNADGVNGNEKQKRSWQERLQIPLLLLLILSIGLFFRLFRFDSLPFGTWYDEAEYALQAMRIQAEPNFRPIFSETINGPAHYLYLVALSFRLFDVSTQSVRAVNGLLGLLSILAAYGVGKELFNRRSGLLLAFLIAVSGWAVNLSRFGMHSTSTTPFFTLVTVYFLLRALRTRRIADFVWAGFGVGLGLCFYTSFRLFVPAVAIFVLYYLIYNWFTKANSVNGRLIGGLFVFGLSAWLAVAPVGIFAWRQPDTFWSRIQKTYIFAEKAPEDRVPILLNSIKQHVLMFNVEGDPNGRHNLPGAPMLDSITGALFVLGVALALWRIRKPPYLLLLSWCGLSLLGGILSLDFEAPQSLRSNGSLTAAYALAVLPLYELWRAWDRGAKPYSRWLATPLFALLAIVGWINYDFYFNRYANDFASWNAWSTPETLAANQLNNLPPDTEPYLINYFRGHPTIHFLTNGKSYRDIQTTDHLPLDWPSDKNVELLFNSDGRSIYDEAQRIYPNATFEELKPAFAETPALFRVFLTQADIQSVQGLNVRYYNNEEWRGEPVFANKDLQINADWSSVAPVALPFSVEWEGVLHVRDYGSHQFFVRAPKHAELYIGEEQIMMGEESLSAGVMLASGNHAIRLRAVGGAGAINFSWKAPKSEIEIVPASALLSGAVRPNGLLGRFFANGDWEEPEKFARIDPELNLYFHDLPLPRPYTVEWSGKIAIPESGEYGFALESIDESTLSINGQQVVGTAGHNQQEHGRLFLEQGLHDLLIRYGDRTDHSHINFYWIPPGFGQQPVPSQVLFPPQANYERVTVPELSQLYFNQAMAITAAPPPGNSDQLPAEVVVLPLPLNSPFGIAAGGDGQIYVADTGNKRLLVLNNQGELVAEVNSADGPFEDPFDVATDFNGQVYLLDAALGRVSVFDQDGNFVSNVPTPQGAAERSRGLFVDADGRIWFAHTSGSRVFAVDQQGNPVLNLNMANEEGAQPIDVAVGSGGNIYVTDGDRHKLTFFTPQGESLFSIELEPANTLSGPHMAVDRNGFIYVTNPEAGRVLKLAPDGQQLGYYDLRPAGVARPVGISVDPIGKIWVTDVDRGRVVMITPPEAIQQPAEAQPESPLNEPSEAQPESPLIVPAANQPEGRSGEASPFRSESPLPVPES